jgi:SnoaL-like domain
VPTDLQAQRLRLNALLSGLDLPVTRTLRVVVKASRQEIDMTATAPTIITRYLHAADARDSRGLAACFTEDGTVLDEGTTYTGRKEITGWRDDLLGKYTFTTTVTGSEPTGIDEYRVTVHVVGDFPGGEANLTYRFTLRGQLIADLRIV